MGPANTRSVYAGKLQLSNQNDALANIAGEFWTTSDEKPCVGGQDFKDLIGSPVQQMPCLGELSPEGLSAS